MIPELPPQRKAPEQAPAPKPQPGAGTLLTANSAGYTISVPDRRASFPHPFRPALFGVRLQFARGVVDGIEPTIGKVRISGDGRTPPPQLVLRPELATWQGAVGESWACLEVEPDAAGVLTSGSRIEMVHSAQPVSRVPEVGRCPIALIVWRDRQPLHVFPIVHFNLRYVRVLSAAGSQGQGVAQHFFL